MQGAVERLRAFGFTVVQDLTTAEENVTFPLPKPLREDAGSLFGGPRAIES